MRSRRSSASGHGVGERLSRALVALSLLAAALQGAIGCQTIAGIVDRHYEPVGKDGGADSGTAPPSALCVSYCDLVMEACAAPTVYPSKETCLGICALLDPGVKPEGNTVLCRMKQAQDAKSGGEGDANCPAAGPGGAEVCGDDCESYCALFGKLCPEDVTDDCVDKCHAVLPDDGTFDAALNGTGNTLQCRLVHTSNATFNAKYHCPHATITPEPGTPCSPTTPNCNDYCRVLMAACTGDHAQYETLAQCTSVCGALDVGTVADQNEDTIGCRTYHSYNALNIDSTHCSHAGPGGDGHCGTGNCPPYCKILAAACPTEFPSFGSPDACETACEKIPGSAAESQGSIVTAKSGGDSVQCRLLHLSRAFADQTECAAALSGAPCE